MPRKGSPGRDGEREARTGPVVDAYGAIAKISYSFFERLKDGGVFNDFGCTRMVALRVPQRVWLQNSTARSIYSGTLAAFNAVSAKRLQKASVVKQISSFCWGLTSVISVQGS